MTGSTFTQVGSGISGQLLFAQECLNGTIGTWGVFPGTTAASWLPLEFKSESFQLKKTTVQGQGLHAGGLFDRLSRRVLTNYDVNATVSFDLPNRNLLLLLMNMTGSPNTLVANATNLYTPSQLASSGAYVSYHSPGNTQGLSLCFQKGVPTTDSGGTTVEPFTYVGCKVSEWEISCETGAIVQASMTLDGRNELAGAGNGDPLNVSVPTLQAFTEANVTSATDPMSVFHFRQATLFNTTSTSTASLSGAGVLSLNGSAAAANIRSASMKETKSLETNRYFLGNNGFKSEQIENGFRQLTGAATAEFLSSELYYNAFAQDTTIGLQLSFVGNVAGTSGTNKDTLTITFPTVKLDGESPMLGGPGIVTENVAFTALDDNITAPYQIQYISSDVTTTS